MKKNCLVTSSGTGALITLLRVFEFEENKNIGIPCYTFMATVNAVKISGYNPISLNIDQNTLIDVENLEKLDYNNHLNLNAIICVHINCISCNWKTKKSIVIKIK